MFTTGPILLLVATSCSYVSAASTKRSPDDLPIKYPGPTKDVDVTRYGMSRPGDDQVPEECRGQNYCHVMPKDYPQENFDKIFSNWTNALRQPELVPDSFANRNGIEDQDDCKSNVLFQPIYQVRDNQMNDWRMVVNLEKKNYVQKIRIEKCQNPGSPCFSDFPPVPGITTYCKQKLSIWNVPVAKGDNEIEYIDTELPVCCSCHYKKVDVEDRFGKPKTKN